jgi:hypothetical protein
MLTQAPISHHLDLYRHWLAKWGDRAMPARCDLDPGEIRASLPYLTILDKVNGQLRCRLHGSAIAQEIGRDMTGRFVGSYVSTPGAAAAMRAVCERVFARAHPVFSTGDLKVKPGYVHNISVLILPLSNDGVTVNMAVCTLVARFNFGVKASTDWLAGILVKIRNVVDVHDAAELEKWCLEWDRNCTGNGDQ